MNTKKWLLGTGILTFALIFNYFTIKQCWAYLSGSSTSIVAAKGNQSNRIQVALLLDTSSSMSGLIEQARSQLWQILNQLSRTVKNGEIPDLEVALYEYGNTARMTGRMQIVKISDFTTDMDLVSEKLFELTTAGGEEYCGQVIDHALNQLEWGGDENDLRMIYIAGNEPFSQGPIDYKTACRLAVSKDISINTIFCGKRSNGAQSGWSNGAELGKGSYMSIEHNEVTTYIETPFDDQINELNQKLNKTYIPYGSQGTEKIQSQTTQDLNAAQYSKANAADRAAFKSSKNYKAEKWDLVDAYKKDKKVIRKNKELPTQYQSLSIEEVEALIEKASAERAQIQDQIRQLDQKRRDYQDNFRQQSTQQNLQNSILKSVEKLSKEKGYEIKE